MMRDLFSYIKAHLKLLFLFLNFVLVATLTFYLYDIPLEVLLYATLLFLVITGIITIWDFSCYHNKKTILRNYQKKVIYSLDELPRAKAQYEKEYQELLNVLLEHKNESVSKRDADLKDSLEYFTMWAHQIKTPIAALDLMLQTDDFEKSEIQEQLFRINEYVDMVMQYLRTNADTNDFVLEKVDLDQVIKGSLRKYSKMFIRKKLKLNYQTTNAVVISDAKWLNFVIEQIISNALKYTKKGEITISFADDCLKIQDTGIGISAEDIKRVVEKGYTGYNGHLNRKSTGIGLYLCKTVLHKLNHQLKIESIVNQGTTVIIEFNTYLTKA